MPPLTAEPTVLVFHARNKISANKVRKYESASEKGISVYEEIRTPTPFGSSPSPSVRHGSSSMGPPPTKKQRLNLLNSNTSAAILGDTIAVARPRKQCKQARRIDLDVHIVWEDGITMIEPEYPPDSDVESDVSTLTPPPPSEKASPERDPPTPEDLEYGAYFQSCYVIDDEEDTAKKAAKAIPVKPPKTSGKPEAPRQQPPPQPVQASQPPQAPSHPQNRAPRSRQAAGRATAALPPPQFLPQPQVFVIENIRRNFNPSKPDTNAEMITKLDSLSQALVNFGGAAPGSQTQPGNNQSGRQNSLSNGTNGGSSRPARGGQDDEPVDGLLAMFDEDDDTDDADRDASHGAGEGATQRRSSLDRSSPTTGTPDGDLTYGIQFIMNALTTWARQRLNLIYKDQWNHYNEAVRQLHQLQQPKKGRGRPKKDEVDAHVALLPPPPPAVVNAELTNTLEGECVQAFQNVLDCGVLKVNGIMPPGLIRALGTLYVQIDHLINNSTKQAPPWQCMSYQAQIKAHNIKVDRWKEQVAKMQEEVARQQELSHQQRMVQMNVPPHLQHRGSLTQEQALKHHDMNLELKRSEQQASQQPHLTQYLITPMDLDSQRSRAVAVPSSSATPVVGGAANVPTPSNQPPGQQPIPVAFQGSSSRVRDPFAKVTMYHDGKPANVAPEHIKQLSMRSGQGMKFSFDHGEQARRLFGDQAFPSATDYSSNIPRRGPMTAPVEHQSAFNGVRPHIPTPVLGSNAPPLNGPVPAADADKEKAGAAAAKRPSSSGADTTTNGIKGSKGDSNTYEVEKNDETPATSVSPAKSPTTTHKRKHSETINGTTSASPAPEKRGKTTIRLGKREASADGVTQRGSARSPETTIAVEE